MLHSTAQSRSVKAVLGPTNTGKTWYAIERMLAHASGMIGLPLRLLAREVYQTVVSRVGEQAVALITGEERIAPASARFWICTAEAMPLDIGVEFLAVDEIQTAIDFDRGHIFTHRILNARGRAETLLLGAATMAHVIRALLPDAEIVYRPRLSELTWAGSKKITRQPHRSAIVAFSAAEVYTIAELVRRERGGAAVVMGALSPRTRNAQVELYQNGDVDFLIATDAIGMGLNLDVHHVAFAADMKFDGRQSRPLTPAELGQIAGRAGRHQRNGTFGVTAGVNEFEPDLIQRLESHEFDPERVIQWRNQDLEFGSADVLLQSLDRTPDHRALTRAPTATDQHTFEFAMRHDAGALAIGEDAVRLLWRCCQLPDYRGISPAMHGDIVTRIYTDLMRQGRIGTDWIAEQVRFCDNTSGDIDTLSNRIRQVRTWTFVANRKNWLEDPIYWRETTRNIEDRLSDALHERLTQRFVDRRTSVLIRHLRDRRMASPEVNDKGEVHLEGHLIGTIQGLRFNLEKSPDDTDAKGLRGAASAAIAPEIAKRAKRIAGSPNEEFILATDGRIRWRGEVIAELAEGPELLAPRVILLSDETLTGPELEAVQDRIGLWLKHLINTQLEQIINLADPPDLDGPARGVAFQISEHLGILPRTEVNDIVKSLDQDVRGTMRKLGIKFGAYHIYLPMTLKPAPRELAIIFWSLKNGGLDQPGVTDLPGIVLAGRTSFEIDPEIDRKLYEVAGFRVAGKRAVRVDILERLADIIRPLISFNPELMTGQPVPEGAAPGNGFRVTVEMTSLLGCAGEDFNSILNSLGYRLTRTPVAAPAPAELTDTQAETAVEGTPPQQGAEDAVAAADFGTAPVTASAPPDPAPALPPADQTDANVREAGESEPPNPVSEDSAAEADPGNAPLAPSGPSELASAAENADTDAPPEAQFDEIWHPGGRRPQANRNDRNRHKGAGHGQKDQDQPARGQKSGRNSEQPQGEGGRQHQGKRSRRGKDGNQGKDATRDERPPKQDNPRRERAPVYDPDSPFAALAALRTGKDK
jgi:ATP-dependent RNA helicase SUPV3L1/SUV3